ncbi:MAG: barstar family protein [Acidobacteria bacterium]|nr:barstar family protein [Acidobacteriota bacterium]
MREIVVSGRCWSSPDDLYDGLLSALGAPEWHGHNMDALWDSITIGQINQIEPPFRIRLVEVDALPDDCHALLERVIDLFTQAQKAGIQVEIMRT